MPQGFGASSRFDAVESNGGFGSPSAEGAYPVVGALGFGSPSPDWLAQNPNVQPYHLDFTNYPDDGGVVVRIVGSFPRTGPWTVRITSDGGATLHPLGEGGCYSGVVGKGAECYTDRNARVLMFVLPPVPLGVYDIWLDDPTVGTLGAVKIIGQITVIRRGQAEEVYATRRTFPPRFKTGARGWSLEDATLPALPTPPLETLTRAFGQVAQQAGGSPQTRLLLPLEFGDVVAHVETTLGFPTSGEVWVGPRRYSYSSTTADQLLGLVLLTSTDALPIPALTEVTCHAPAVKPS